MNVLIKNEFNPIMKMIRLKYGLVTKHVTKLFINLYNYIIYKI